MAVTLVGNSVDSVWSNCHIVHTLNVLILYFMIFCMQFMQAKFISTVQFNASVTLQPGNERAVHSDNQEYHKHCCWDHGHTAGTDVQHRAKCHSCYTGVFTVSGVMCR